MTATAGSMIYLDGQAGDLVVTLRHLKQPAREIGPLTIRHDHAAGRTVVHKPGDLLELAAGGITARKAAELLFKTTSPNPNKVEKARRRLDKHADRGELERVSNLGRTTAYRNPER